MFSAHLINDPFGDPGVYLEFQYRRSALLFDLGDLHSLPARKLLKVGHIFVSHTHMDHFVGFDHLLRLCLGRDRHVHLYGPAGFRRNVESRIASYTWNLVENTANDFTIFATEVDADRRRTTGFRCRNAFRPEQVAEADFNGVLLDERSFRVKAVQLDHRIPSLAFRFEEKSRINIMKNRLLDMGLPVGAWLTDFKEAVTAGAPDDAPVPVIRKERIRILEERSMRLGDLRERILKITPGRVVAYVTDAVDSEANRRRMVEIARDADLLFIEAAFADEDAERAAEKFHLTARQAGSIAAAAGARRVVPFHFSPKYEGDEERLLGELNDAAGGLV
ncbi:MAG: Ribonuclease Z [Syntrophaceae bacterium PtaU1.Bin231]|nr:MAG: Ribonuclease Z [Syntrophaceae bacterium PtaU1.Bin231]